MTKRPFAVYHAFSDVAFGGSRAALVDDAAGLDADTMQQLAIEFSAPATGFISQVSDQRVEVRFFSTKTEYPMCGHGTVALAGWLVDRGLIEVDSAGTQLSLVTPSSEAKLQLNLDNAGRLITRLVLQPAAFETWQSDSTEMLVALGLTEGDLMPGMPIGFTNTDFRHLIVAVDQLSSLQNLKTDMARLESCCREQGIDTVMLFCRETENPDTDFHCREFAPAVGAPEVPATGTTNRALACFLHQFGVMPFADNGATAILVEQGIEMRRPSRIYSTVKTAGGRIAEVTVGGHATKTLEGLLSL